MYNQRYGNKFGAKKTFFKDRRYDSKKEAGVAQELELLKKAGEIKEIIPQFKLDLKVYGKHICNYYVDFKVINKDGSIEYIEVKGLEMPLWKMKWRLAEVILNEEEPGSKLTVIK